VTRDVSGNGLCAIVPPTPISINDNLVKGLSLPMKNIAERDFFSRRGLGMKTTA